ncbi:hypothetical protein D3C77_541670 [compost metagenome]
MTFGSSSALLQGLTSSNNGRTGFAHGGEEVLHSSPRALNGVLDRFPDLAQKGFGAFQSFHRGLQLVAGTAEGFGGYGEFSSVDRQAAGGDCQSATVDVSGLRAHAAVGDGAFQGSDQAFHGVGSLRQFFNSFVVLVNDSGITAGFFQNLVHLDDGFFGYRVDFLAGIRVDAFHGDVQSTVQNRVTHEYKTPCLQTEGMRRRRSLGQFRISAHHTVFFDNKAG